MTEEKYKKSRLPDFIIIGAAKSGTTSLYDFLLRHPDIFLPELKEPCFFDESEVSINSIEKYTSLFSSASDNQLCGEASTNYTRWPQVVDVPEKIRELIPDVKLIYIMRDPVKRSYAHFVHRWTKETHKGESFNESFFEYVKTDMMCIDSSMYYMQLEKYLKAFPAKQIFPVVFEELLAKPEIVIGNIFNFLGLKSLDIVGEHFPNSNNNKEFRYHIKRRLLVSKLMKIPGVKPLKRILPDYFKNYIYDLLSTKTRYGRQLSEIYTPPALTKNELMKLRRMFYESNISLSEKWDVNINYWGD